MRAEAALAELGSYGVNAIMTESYAYVSVAYLKAPFYANFKTGLDDRAQAVRLRLRSRRR
jgi:hypothetical protein